MLRRALVLASVVACGGSSDTSTHALFDANDADFYALPFPNDMRRHDDGSLDLSKFPAKTMITQQYVDAAATLDGFGLNEAAYARFDGALDPASLPDVASSAKPGASVYIVNVDPASAGKGTRVPTIVHFLADARGTVGPNSMSARPYPGFALDEGTTYALVITNRVHDAAGAPVAIANGFAAQLAMPGWYQPLAAWLDEPGDDERADVVSAAVFTTQHATQIVPAIRKGVYGTPAPVATGVQINNGPVFKLVTGNYMAPNLQKGTVPYHTDGEIIVGADGAAVVQRMEAMRFAMTTPLTPMPSTGWPIVIYQHGTGGDWMSFIDDGTAGRLVAQGLAVISTDQVLHGPRNPGGSPDVDFYNIGNPQALRDNIMQGSADAWSQLRLAAGFAIPDAGNTIAIDPTKVYFFGHSQGSATGPGFVAFEPSLTGAVMSGCSGVYYLLALYKTQPIDIPSAVEALIRDEPFDDDNPTLALLQMWLEHSDGANYARLMVRDPVTAAGPRNIFQTEGFTDTYAPNPTIEAFATALGGDLVQTPDEKDVPGMDLRGRTVKTPPIMDNLDGVTVVLAQYKQAPGSDGHFVVFDIASAQQQSSQFLGTLARTGHATVVTPQ